MSCTGRRPGCPPPSCRPLPGRARATWRGRVTRAAYEPAHAPTAHGGRDTPRRNGPSATGGPGSGAHLPAPAPTAAFYRSGGDGHFFFFFLLTGRPPSSPLFPNTPLFR